MTPAGLLQMRHGLPLALLFAACTSTSPSRESTPPAGRPSAPLTGAAFFADVVSKVQAQSVDETSAERLGAAALKGLENLPPKGALRVTVEQKGGRLTHGESGSADAVLSLSWPSPAASTQIGEALDKAATFAVDRLGAQPPDVLDAMLRGLMAFDADGSYLGAAAYTALQSPGPSGSCGLEVVIRQGVLTVLSPITSGPAERAGLKAGDQIISIDGISTAGLGLPQVNALLSGKPGSRATLSLVRPEASAPREVVLTREIVPAATVERKMLGRVGYLRVHRLPQDAAARVTAALDALRSEGAQALVLDLRGCSGGLLTAAVEVTELFLEDRRLLTYTEGRSRNQNMRFSAHAKRATLDLRLAVLVDDRTAAGCEIIGAALQDWGRATLVGTRTAGRTTIQTVIPLDNGAAIRLTTARWFTPKGRSLAGRGLTPDTEVRPDEDPGRPLGSAEHDAQLRAAVDVVGKSSTR